MLYVAQSKKLKVNHTKAKVKWSSSNKKIAKVSKKGTVKAVKPGKCTIYAKVKGKKLKCKVEVVFQTAILWKKFIYACETKRSKRFIGCQTHINENKTV